VRETEAGKLLSIVFVKLAYYAPSTAKNFGNYARIMLVSLNYAPRLKIMLLGF